MSDLPDGDYTIFSAATDFVVGRNVREDRSLRPKGIFTLDPSVGTDGGRRWTIKSVGGGKYKISAGGAPVGARDGLLWAFLTDEGASSEWRIQDISYQGENYYIIAKPDLGTGWVANFDDPDQQQIVIRPLIVQPSYPPRYPPFEVFVIKPAAD